MREEMRCLKHCEGRGDRVTLLTWCGGAEGLMRSEGGSEAERRVNVRRHKWMVARLRLGPDVPGMSLNLNAWGSVNVWRRARGGNGNGNAFPRFLGLQPPRQALKVLYLQDQILKIYLYSEILRCSGKISRGRKSASTRIFKFSLTDVFGSSGAPGPPT